MRPGGVTQADIHGHDGDMWEETVEEAFDKLIKEKEEELKKRLAGDVEVKK